MSPGAYLMLADARAIPLADNSVQCVVTSPPYWGLRDYGVPGQLGLEKTPEEYVQNMVEVFREVRRVLRDDGTCWLNLGDSYAGSWGNQGRKPERGSQRPINGPMLQSLAGQYPDRESNTGAVPPGLKPKDLVGVPWRVAFALQADGWWLRSDIVWAKPNPMPESITDRPTKAHEYLFLLTKSARYFYDSESIKEPGSDWGPRDRSSAKHNVEGFRASGQPPHHWLTNGNASAGRNRRSVWTIATEPYPEAHFATFPEKLVEPCIQAGTSERGACPACGAPWGREVSRAAATDGRERLGDRERNRGGRQDGYTKPPDGYRAETETIGWSPSCDCPAAEPVPCRVLDPFSGSGTTVAVAERLGRVGLGVELKPDYLALARKRTAQAGLL